MTSCGGHGAGRAATSGRAGPPAPVDLDTAKLDEIIGAQGPGQTAASISSVVPRREPIKRIRHDDRARRPDGRGNRDQFPADRRRKAAITGDFVLIGAEVNPVLRALRQNGIEVTAMHSHMLTISPASSSCISGRTTTRKNSPRGFATRSTRRRVRKRKSRVA